MEEPAATKDTIQLPPPTVVSPAPNEVANVFQPKDPIILSPGVNLTQTESTKRSFLSTFGLLLSGWFVGNLIILACLGIVAVTVVGATGLVKVPVLTTFLFGKALPEFTPVESFALDEATTKLNEVKTLPKGQTLKSIEFSQVEINALLNQQIDNATGFLIANQNLQLGQDQFILTGNLVSTNAPIKIVGNITASNLAAHIAITQSKFGKIDIPTVLAENILDSNLSKIGLSLTGSTLPAQSLKVSPGKIVLQEVSNPNQ